ncbi:hypothetical protein G7046_g3080 [Stylonectria norvegica]|nr:hypothetical protein G7046_g3080 [Stylonectria norvegica]
MFGFDEAKDKRDEVYDGQHEGHLSHEVIAGGAAFEGMRKWEESQRNKGEVVNHSFAKELLAGFAAAEVDKLAETRGMDYVDKERTKHQAKKQAEHLYDQQYSDQDQYDPNESRRHPSMDY